MTGASAAARAIVAARERDGAEPLSLQELHVAAARARRQSARP